MSLADELLADFEEDEGDEDVEADAEMTEVTDAALETDYSDKESVKHVAKLRDSQQVKYSPAFINYITYFRILE